MNTFQLAATLSKLQPKEREIEAMRLAFSQMNAHREQAFFEYCLHWKLAPWAYTQLGRTGLKSTLGTAVQQAFQQQHEQAKADNEARAREALRFLKRFREEGIAVVVLKGNLFMDSIYEDTGYKRMNDFDLLIHPEDWPRARAIYIELGYIPLGFGWSGEKEAAAKFSHTGMSFISPDYTCITGTQWGLKSPTSSYTVDIAEAWATAKPLDFRGEPVLQLSKEYNLLHLILHMGLYKCGIRDCMDVYNLFRSGQPADEEHLARIVRKAKAVEKAFFTLSLSNLCSASIPPSLLEKLRPEKPGFITRRLSSRLSVARQTGDFQVSYNDYFQEVEMCVFYFNLFPSFHKRLALYARLLKLLFWPRAQLAWKLSDLPEGAGLPKKTMARAVAPYLAIRTIGEEIGLGIVFLLLGKFLADMLLSVRFYAYGGESYFDYLQSRGISPGEIKAAVKKIQ